VLAALEHPPLVVFVTAHGHYAVRAFEVEAVDYLTKPFDEDRLAVSLDRLRARLAAPPPPMMIGTRARIAVRDGDATVLVALDDIESVEAAGKLVELRLANGNRQSARETLADLEHRLDPARFVRIHRSLIVNLDHVSVVKPWFAGDQELVLSSGRTVTTGRGYRDRLLARLKR
jgi:two-component system LytT family response regulator